MKRRNILFISLSLLGIAVFLLLDPNTRAAQAQGTILHVAPGGDCGGASPCYATIQAAVDAASNGDTIKVAQGTYTSIGSMVVGAFTHWGRALAQTKHRSVH
jgi:pectin methylesterase-like acyl-CoA thioesterase